MDADISAAISAQRAQLASPLLRNDLLAGSCMGDRTRATDLVGSVVQSPVCESHRRSWIPESSYLCVRGSGDFVSGPDLAVALARLLLSSSIDSVSILKLVGRPRAC